MTDEVRPVDSLKGEPVAALALASGSTITEAARQAGLSERTVRRRLDRVEYRAEIARLRRKVLDGILARLLTGATTGVDTLIEIAANGQSESARVSASRILVEHSLSFAELVGVSERIADLEHAIYGHHTT